MKTNLDLVAYVKSKLNLPTIYMLGGFGRKLTKAQIDRRVNVLKCQHTIKNLSTITAGIGKYCFDCVGLIKGCLWETEPGKVVYNIPKGSDQNVSMMYNSAVEKGLLKDMPDIQGLLVFTKDLGHVGVYIGKNEKGERQYVEATPAFNAWGVTQSNDKIRKWTYWGKYHLIQYIIPRTKRTHTVQKGEWLIKIAKKYNMKWTDLAKLNGLKAPWILKVGQKLIIK